MKKSRAQQSGPFHMDLELKDRLVSETGGAKGIGAAITTTYAQEDAIAVAGDRDVPACQALRDEVRAQGLQASFIAMDLARSENCEAIGRPAIATLITSMRS
jgi:NAD(P)-dependent dehydrogenase (short-subunit alcohol dehydrogenase family)